MERALEKKLEDAGYRLLGRKENIEKLILNILKTKDMRYLKAIPFLIYKHNPNLEAIYRQTAHKEIFGQTIEFTKKIFQENNITVNLPKIIGKSDLNYEEFRQEFELQRFNAEKPEMMIEKQKASAERDLQMWLSRIFTKKERQIMTRIMMEKAVSKTDYEYYSRKTKKKLNDILRLQDFARTLSSKSPRQDEGLFKLKRMLEEWLMKTEKHKEAKLQRFSILDDGKIFICFEEKKKSGQMFSITKKIKEFKNDEIIRLFEEYKDKEYEF
jgi:hypothetical protein